MSFTNATLSGSIKKNAEQRSTPNGASVTNFMLDVKRYDNRAKEEKVYPVKVNMWGDSFADLLPRLTQGQKVVVSGRLQLDQFTDRNGKNVKLLCIEASRVQLLSDIASSSTPVSSYDSSFSATTDAFENQEVPF